MTSPVFAAPKALSEYEPHVGEERLAELRALAAPLQDARVLHLNATSFGGGVAEILNSFIPLLRDLGVDAEWHVMEASAEFFNVSKSMHNALQGMYIPWNKAMADLWRETNAANADTMEGAYDFVYVHDPQPAGVLAHLRERDPDALGAKWLWRRSSAACTRVSRCRSPRSPSLLTTPLAELSQVSHSRARRGTCRVRLIRHSRARRNSIGSHCTLPCKREPLMTVIPA